MIRNAIRPLYALAGAVRRALAQHDDPALAQSDYDQMRRVMLK